MKILIVEPLAIGHYTALYTRFLVRAASKNGWCIQFLTTEKVKNSDDFKLVQKESSEEIRIFLMNDVYRTNKSDSLSLFLQQDKYYRAIKSGFSQIKPDQLPDIVYMVNFDHFDKALSLWGSPFGSTPFTGMMMSIKYHQYRMGIGPTSRNNWLYKQLFKKLLRLSTLKKVAVIDEVFWQYTNQFPCLEYKKINLVPDVGEIAGNKSRQEARESFGLAESNFVILVYGALAKRKGINELIEAVINLNNSEIVILVAGRIVDTHTHELLNNSLARSLASNGQLIESKGFHNQERECEVFRAADAVWLGYVEGARGSSGVLYQAGSSCLPVLATKEGLIGWLVKKHGLGITFNPTNYNEVSTSINQFYSDEKLRNSCALRGYSLSQKHTGLVFGDSLCDLIISSTS